MTSISEMGHICPCIGIGITIGLLFYYIWCVYICFKYTNFIVKKDTFRDRLTYYFYVFILSPILIPFITIRGIFYKD